jgi:hypothetical protein
MNKIDTIKMWAENKKFFNTEFIDDLISYESKNGKLTENQEKAVDNIYYKFHIDKFSKEIEEKL